MTAAIEDFKTHVINLHLCVDMAVDIRDLLLAREAAAEAHGVADLAIDEVLLAVRKHFPAPLAAARKHALGDAIVAGLVSYGTTTCVIWHIAHMLEHILFEEDLEEFR